MILLFILKLKLIFFKRAELSNALLIIDFCLMDWGLTQARHAPSSIKWIEKQEVVLVAMCQLLSQLNCENLKTEKKW